MSGEWVPKEVWTAAVDDELPPSHPRWWNVAAMVLVLRNKLRLHPTAAVMAAPAVPGGPWGRTHPMLAGAVHRGLEAGWVCEVRSGGRRLDLTDKGMELLAEETAITGRSAELRAAIAESVRDA